MTAVLDSQADVDVAVQTARADRIGARELTDLINELRQSLRDLDRIVYPGSNPRLDWDVVGLRQSSKALRMKLSPNQRALRRQPGTLALPSAALVDGVASLHQTPEIPLAFNDSLVSRVKVLGRIVGADVNQLDLSRPGIPQVGIVDDATVRNAVSAVNPVTSALGSVVGRLDTLTTRKVFRAQIYKHGRGISLLPAHGMDLEQELKDLFGHEVEAWGLLRRNQSGQAVGMIVQEVRPRQQVARFTAASLLGIDPYYTGELTTEQYMAEVRGGR